jgi:hypothetical protein
LPKGLEARAAPFTPFVKGAGFLPIWLAWMTSQLRAKKNAVWNSRRQEKRENPHP